MPPIRFRKNVLEAWLGLPITEVRNRQVRRMTATIGHPTLQLIRERVGNWRLGYLQPGEWKEIPCPGHQAELFSAAKM